MAVLVIGVIGLAVAATGVVVNAVETSKTRKAGKSAAGASLVAQQKAAACQALVTLEVGESNNIASIINATEAAQAQQDAAAQQAAIAAQGQVHSASVTAQGQVLMIVGTGIIIISLARLVLRKKGQEPKT